MIWRRFRFDERFRPHALGIHWESRGSETPRTDARWIDAGMCREEVPTLRGCINIAVLTFQGEKTKTGLSESSRGVGHPPTHAYLRASPTADPATTPKLSLSDSRRRTRARSRYSESTSRGWVFPSHDRIKAILRNQHQKLQRSAPLPLTHQARGRIESPSRNKLLI